MNTLFYLLSNRPITCSCFSILKRMQCILRNTIVQEKFNALITMSLTEKRKLVQQNLDFEDTVRKVLVASNIKRNFIGCRIQSLEDLLHFI